MTVTLAYQELAAQGFIESSARSGYRVAEYEDILGAAGSIGSEPDGAIDWHSRLCPDKAIYRGVEKPADWRRYPYPFVYGQLDMNLFDLPAWRECTRQALRKRDFEDMAGDAAAADDALLVNYICLRTLPMRGIEASPDQVLVTLGAQNAIWLVIQLLLGRDRHAVHENPCHPDLLAALRLSGARLTGVDIDQGGLPPSNLPRDADMVLVTPSHQAPTGVTMPLARRQQLIEAAAEHDFVVVEDDYEFEMSYLKPPSSAFKAMDRLGRVIYVGSFSKSLFPGLRLGYIVAPAAFIQQARNLRALMLRHPPGHLQRTTAYFLALGHYDVLIRRMRRTFRERYQIMLASLEQEGLKVASDSHFGGSGLWIEGPPNLDADHLAAILCQDGVVIETGSPFFHRWPRTMPVFPAWIFID